MFQARSITPETFEEDVLQADRPVLLEIWGDDCAICKAIAPTIDALAADLRGRVNVLRLWADPSMPLIEQLQVRGIPTMILFNRGEALDRLSGMQHKHDLVALIDKHIPTSGGGLGDGNIIAFIP